jgi:hypothetical protein
MEARMSWKEAASGRIRAEPTIDPPQPEARCMPPIAKEHCRYTAAVEVNCVCLDSERESTTAQKSSRRSNPTVAKQTEGYV